MGFLSRRWICQCIPPLRWDAYCTSRAKLRQVKLSISLLNSYSEQSEHKPQGYASHGNPQQLLKLKVPSLTQEAASDASKPEIAKYITHIICSLLSRALDTPPFWLSQMFRLMLIFLPFRSSKLLVTDQMGVGVIRMLLNSNVVMADRFLIRLSRYWKGRWFGEIKLDAMWIFKT